MEPMPKLTEIDDPIADDLWSYVDEAGTKNFTRIMVGRPRLIPGDLNKDWFCPLRLDAQYPSIQSIGGTGPVDALMNAMGVVKAFFDEHREVTPRETPPSPVTK